MTVEEVEGVLQQIRELQDEIDEAAQKRDASIRFFQSRIATAEKNFDNETKSAKLEIANLSILLEAYYDENPPKKKKSIPFVGGTIAKVKQHPKFYLGGKEIQNNDERLIAIVKQIAPEYVKVKSEEYTDWAKLKGKLLIVDDGVVFEETGEFIPDMRGRIEPDKFTVTLS